MPFKDRIQAGHQLAQALQGYANQPDTLVIALPRGGVVVGFEIASMLHLPLDIVCPRKIGAPLNPELAIGAITERGESILSEDLIAELGVSSEYIKAEMEIEMQEARRRLDHYRKSRPPCDLTGKIVILVDDGIATGSTMRAAIKTLKAAQTQKIVLAIPVAPQETLHLLEQEVDKVVCLSSPSPFYAVGQFYQVFDQTTDEEVIALLQQRFNHRSALNVV